MDMIEDLNPYKSPRAYGDDVERESLLVEITKGILIPGYAFVSEYKSDRFMHERGEGDFRANFTKGLPLCFLMEASKIYIGTVFIYGLIL